MSVEVWSLALNAKIDKPSTKAVLLGLANHAWPDGTNVRPSVRRLCIYTSWGESTVRRGLAELRDAGIIRVVKKAYRYRPTEYEIDMKKLEAMRHPDLQLLEASSKTPTYRGVTPAGLDESRGVNLTGLATRTVNDDYQDCQSRPSGVSPTQGEPYLTVKEPLLSIRDSLLSDSADSISPSENPWTKALAIIGSTYYPKKMHFGSSDWHRYWSATRYGSVEDGRFVVLCVSEEQKAWLEDRGKIIAERQLMEILDDEDVEVEFVVSEGENHDRVD